jgi:Predicted membrane protein (DUF2306)
MAMQLARWKTTLNATITIWFILAVLGQWLFAIYTAIFYGKATIVGNYEKWNEVLPKGYVPGETMGNLAVGTHLLLAVLVIVGGPIQLIPRIRRIAPDFHRWNGRLYVILAFITSLSGLYMVWVRGSIGGIIQHLSISINAILIMLFAILTVRYGVLRDLKVHRQWAIRLFLAVNGVWFFRVGLYFWLFIHGRPVGFNPETFEGPFLYVLTFSQYLIPLGVFELYQYARYRNSTLLLKLTTAVLVIFTIIMIIGIFAVSVGMWLPKIQQ